MTTCILLKAKTHCYFIFGPKDNSTDKEILNHNGVKTLSKKKFVFFDLPDNKKVKEVDNVLTSFNFKTIQYFDLLKGYQQNIKRNLTLGQMYRLPWLALGRLDKISFDQDLGVSQASYKFLTPNLIYAFLNKKHKVVLWIFEHHLNKYYTLFVLDKKYKLSTVVDVTSNSYLTIGNTTLYFQNYIGQAWDLPIEIDKKDIDEVYKELNSVSPFVFGNNQFEVLK